MMVIPPPLNSYSIRQLETTVPAGMVDVEGTTVSGAVGDSQVFIANRSVTIADFLMCDHEVTQAEYLDVTGKNPSVNTTPFSGELQGDYPCDSVTWYEAIVYCNKRSVKEQLDPCYAMEIAGIDVFDTTQWGTLPKGRALVGGQDPETQKVIKCDFTKKGYRLPTEAEWEYAARGGKTGIAGTQTKYSGSDTLVDVAWYSGNAKNNTHAVCKKRKNALNIGDMTGNVWEWCWDWNTPIDKNTDSTGSATGTQRILRGGSYYQTVTESQLLISYRSESYMHNPSKYSSDYGFRVCRTK